MKETIIVYMLEVLNTIKIHHWNTFGYSTHKALGNLYDEFGGLMDEFVEVMMGKYGRPEYPESFTLELGKPENVDITAKLKECVEYLIGLSNELNQEMDSDLLNIRDEMMASINKTIYLLTLTK